jgi:hypothetical protein
MWLKPGQSGEATKTLFLLEVRVMDMSHKAIVMRRLKEAVRDYRELGYIDGDCLFHVRYYDGVVKTFPDEAESIKLRGIANVWYLTADDCGDFTYDFIGTREQYNFIFNVVCDGNPFFKPDHPLILDETVDYGRVFEGPK